MLSISIHVPNRFLDFSPQLFLRFNSFEVTGSCRSNHCSRRGKRKKQELRFLAVKETRGLVVLESRKRGSCWGCGSGGGFLRSCSKGVAWESGEGDFALEAEILKFMQNSKNPEMFPSKKDLIDAGRTDLVDAILKQGGWLASGWDFDDDEPRGSDNDDDIVDWDFFIKKGDEKCSDVPIQENFLEGSEEESSSVSCLSGRSLETAAEDDSGIDGILCRLQKERNMNLGFALREIGSSTSVQSSDLNRDWLSKTSKDGTVADQKGKVMPGSFNSSNGLINDLEGKLDLSRSFSNFDVYGNSLMPDMRRTSSIQRAGVPDMEFEAEEIDSDRTMGGGVDTLGDDHYQIQSRLQHLELELSSALQKLKSDNGESASQKGNERSSDKLLKLSDAWEFQENEIMNAQDKLRSMRAQLAVLEGKMALAIIDTQKSVEEKQQRIDDARRALKLLRSACIVWPSSASEVLVTGSFDGWATQRRMNKTSVGIFSLDLKLYPGRYEIKFIVDGEWRIDPLRPIVRNNGYENNLLVIT